MLNSVQGWLDRRGRHSAARQWSRLAGLGGGAHAGLRDEARALHADLARFLQLADAALPRDPQPAGLPPGTDWHWRPPLLGGAALPQGLVAPDSGQRLGEGVALWHDCPHRAVILRQIRNRRGDLAPYAARLEVMGFSGSYLSLALDLPGDIPGGLGREQILRLEAQFAAERPVTVYARLNLAQGPDTMTMLRQLGDPLAGPDCRRLTEFDLDYAGLSARPVERAWLDLIVEAPAMNALTLGELLLSRHPRAQV